MCFAAARAEQRGPDAVLEAAGPALTVREVESQGGIFQRYETNFRNFAEFHWNLEGAKWDRLRELL
jgi:hypothetical protein